MLRCEVFKIHHFQCCCRYLLIDSNLKSTSSFHRDIRRVERFVSIHSNPRGNGKLYDLNFKRNYRSFLGYKNNAAKFNIEEPSTNNPKDINKLEFLTHNGSSNVKFSVIKNYMRRGRKFSKLSTRFHFGKQYGDDTFFATYWKPGYGDKFEKGSVNALVFICHGYGEYLGDAYDEIAEFWCSELGGGSLVFGHDHVGHGRSSAGERVLIDNIDDLVEPVISHVKSVLKWNDFGENRVPVFLVGHSMGGLISLLALLRNQQLFEGFIGVSPLAIIGPDRATPTNILLAKSMQKYFPNFILPSFLDDNNDRHITRNEAFVENLKKDHLRWHAGPKARTGWLLLESCKTLENNLSGISIPLLILQGGEDKLVDPMGAKIIHDKSRSTDKEYKIYPEAFHNLFVELDDVKSDVQMKTLQWMGKRLK